MPAGLTLPGCPSLPQPPCLTLPWSPSPCPASKAHGMRIQCHCPRCAYAFPHCSPHALTPHALPDAMLTPHASPHTLSLIAHLMPCVPRCASLTPHAHLMRSQMCCPHTLLTRSLIAPCASARLALLTHCCAPHTCCVPPCSRCTSHFFRYPNQKNAVTVSLF